MSTLARRMFLGALVALNATLLLPARAKAEPDKMEICDLQNHIDHCDKVCVLWVFTQCDFNHCVDDCTFN